MGISEAEIIRGHDIGGEPFRLIARTTHDDGIIIETAVHGESYHHHIGGVRITERARRAEVGYLAAAMTPKCAVADLPAGGQKTVVGCPMGAPPLPQLAQHIDDHIRVVRQQRGIWPIFGPDMGLDERGMDRLASTHQQADFVAGCSRAHGGLSIDEVGFTAMGLAESIRLACQRQRLDSMIIQGFGAVGAHLAQHAGALNLSVRAVNNINGTLIDLSDQGLDIDRLVRLREVVGDDCLARYAAESKSASFRADDRDSLFEVQADIFVPAARVNALATADELDSVRMQSNPEAIDVEHFWRFSGVRLVVQGANHPLTTLAEHALEAHGVTILPDYLVNLGGLVGCFYGWLYRDKLGDGRAQLDAINKLAQAHLREAVKRNVETLFEMGSSARHAAQHIARNRLLDVQAKLGGRADEVPSRMDIRKMLGLPESPISA